MKADLFRFDGSQPCDLSRLPTGAGEEKGRKDEYAAKTAANLRRMEALQEALYADGREGLVILLQALDAAGKDGTIKHVMGGLNPQGVAVYNFKQPTKIELQHDYLWRVGRCLPPRGGISIFNRSYYEDVLVVQLHRLHKNYRMADRVLEDNDQDFFEKRYRQIRHFEEYLYENSFRVVKIFLHISKKEQKERFLERIDTPDKNWKFSPDDITERASFEEYNRLYSQVISATATEHAPWFALPADQKWYTRYLVSEIVVEALQKCAPAYPKMTDQDRAAMQRARIQLMAED